MRSRQLHDALEKLTKAIREVEAVVEIMRAEHDPLASHIFVSRRGFRRDMSAFAAFKGNLEFTLYQLVGIIIGAGFWRRVSVPRFPLSVARHAPRRHQSSMGRRVFDPGDTVRVDTWPTRTRSVCCSLDRSASSWGSSSSPPLVTSGCLSSPTRYTTPPASSRSMYTGRHRGERPTPLVAVQLNYYAFGLNSARESQGTTARR
jgi:hypothetical protein